MIITNHACERYLQRSLGYISWTKEDITKTREYLWKYIHSQEHINISTKFDETMCVIVGELILIIKKVKNIILTIYTKIPMTTLEKLESLKVNGVYPDPKLLSVAITSTKKKIYIIINNVKPRNVSGIFGSVEKAEKFISDYTEFYNSKHLE